MGGATEMPLLSRADSVLKPSYNKLTITHAISQIFKKMKGLSDHKVLLNEKGTPLVEET